MPKQKKGFTLIELLVVIAIIGILSAIGLVSLNGAREKARDSKRESDLAQIKSAMALYYDDNTSSYFAAATPVQADSTATGGAGTFKNAVAPYLANLPQVAKSGDAGQNGGYWYVGTTATFAVFTKLEGTQSGISQPWYILNEIGFGGVTSAGSALGHANVSCGNTAGSLDACESTPAVH